jgi:hypothetical protein
MFKIEHIQRAVRCGIENDGLSVPECALITINFEEEGKDQRSEAFTRQDQHVLISVLDRELTFGEAR